MSAGGTLLLMDIARSFSRPTVARFICSSSLLRSSLVNWSPAIHSAWRIISGVTNLDGSICANSARAKVDELTPKLNSVANMERRDVLPVNLCCLEFSNLERDIGFLGYSNNSKIEGINLV